MANLLKGAYAIYNFRNYNNPNYNNMIVKDYSGNNRDWQLTTSPDEWTSEGLKCTNEKSFKLVSEVKQYDTYTVPWFTEYANTYGLTFVWRYKINLSNQTKLQDLVDRSVSYTFRNNLNVKDYYYAVAGSVNAASNTIEAINTRDTYILNQNYSGYSGFQFFTNNGPVIQTDIVTFQNMNGQCYFQYYANGNFIKSWIWSIQSPDYAELCNTTLTADSSLLGDYTNMNLQIYPWAVDKYQAKYIYDNIEALTATDAGIADCRYIGGTPIDRIYENGVYEINKLKVNTNLKLSPIALNELKKQLGITT